MVFAQEVFIMAPSFPETNNLHPKAESLHPKAESFHPTGRLEGPPAHRDTEAGPRLVSNLSGSSRTPTEYL